MPDTRRETKCKEGNEKSTSFLGIITRTGWKDGSDKWLYAFKPK